ncbi:MAG: hypothetical protein K2V38_22925, partial [Gemmataceae bacterium]|nr:hypothetical protein [Gemmataceae bacterium]
AGFELAINVLLADGAFEPALRAADAYAAVAVPPRERERKADVLSAWATALQKDRQPPAAWKDKFKAAADEFAALAAFQPKPDGKVEVLRRAAALYRQADSPEAAVGHLKEAVKLPGVPDALVGPLWVELADALIAAKQTDEVWKVFNEAMSTHSAATVTRYRLARQFIDSRHPELVKLGRGLLEQIAGKQNVTPAEREFHERALNELANDLIRQGNFADAETRLRSQLAQYKDGPEAQLARLQLGVCLLQRAAQTPAPDPKRTAIQNDALAIFKGLVAECDQAERVNKRLTEREAWLRLQSSVRVLQVYQQMGRPNDLLAGARPLLDRHQGTVDELIILSLMYHAYLQFDKQAEGERYAALTRERMKEAFDKLPAAAFRQPTGEYSREYWAKVWRLAP